MFGFVILVILALVGAVLLGALIGDFVDKLWKRISNWWKEYS